MNEILLAAFGGGLVAGVFKIIEVLIGRRESQATTDNVLVGTAFDIVTALKEDLAGVKVELAGLKGAVRIHLMTCPDPADLQRKLDQL